MLTFLVSVLGEASHAAEAKSSLGTPELLLLELLMLVVIGVILYNLWGTIRVFGGKIGEALKVVGAGIFLFSFEAVDKVLGHFDLDYIGKVLGHTGGEVLKVLGLFLLAWGLSKLSKVYSSK